MAGLEAVRDRRTAGVSQEETRSHRARTVMDGVAPLDLPSSMPIWIPRRWPITTWVTQASTKGRKTGKVTGPQRASTRGSSKPPRGPEQRCPDWEPLAAEVPANRAPASYRCRSLPSWGPAPIDADGADPWCSRVSARIRENPDSHSNVNTVRVWPSAQVFGAHTAIPSSLRHKPGSERSVVSAVSASGGPMTCQDAAWLVRYCDEILPVVGPAEEVPDPSGRLRRRSAV